jgi:hypothetical protein
MMKELSRILKDRLPDVVEALSPKAKPLHIYIANLQTCFFMFLDTNFKYYFPLPTQYPLCSDFYFITVNKNFPCNSSLGGLQVIQVNIAKTTQLVNHHAQTYLCKADTIRKPYLPSEKETYRSL